MFFNSCQDSFMEFDPSNAVDENVAITNELQLENAVLGIYDGIQHANVYGNNLITAQEILSDNGFVILDNSNRFTDFNDYTHAIATGGTISNMWTMMYRVISRANNVISFEDKIEGTNVKSKIAEAKAARALILFNLVNYYARPYGTINQDLGVPVPLKYEVGVSIKRSSVEEVYAQIIEDLNYAVANLNMSSKSRFSKDAVYGLLSRVYLFKKDYPKVIENANLALTNTSYVNGEDLTAYYQDPLSSKETLLGVDFTALDNPGANDALAATWLVGGRYEQNMASINFYNLIGDNDSRKALYKEMTGLADDPTPYGVLKFGGLGNDVIILRASEVNFNKIEALYYTNPSQALLELNSWMNTYRDNTYNFTGSGEAILQEILKQRRIELAFEGHRLFDLNRYSLDVEKGPNNTVNRVVPFTDYKRVFPIPFNEMNTNELMVQNPEYK